MTKCFYSALRLPMLLLLCLPAVRMLSAADVPPAPHPDCKTTCRDVYIPYPFGIGDRCAMQGFNISCDTVNGIQRPFLMSLEVTKISLADTKVWVKMPISQMCYNAETRSSRTLEIVANFSGSPYRFSDTDNKIFVIGCNTLGFIRGTSHVLGCLSNCYEEEPRNGSCSGAGCCEVDVPKRIDYIEAYFNPRYNFSGMNSSCGYVVLMAKEDFRYDKTYMSNGTFLESYKDGVPVVLDWAIRSGTCKIAKDSPACISDKSECLNATNGNGYFCKCLNGYTGNPYVKDGCQDIDECSSEHPCSDICQNTSGSFTCSCPPGKELSNNEVCIAIRKPSSWLMPVVAGASVGLLVLVATITCACFIRERRKLRHMRQRYFRQHGGLLLIEEFKSKQGTGFKIFSEAELQEATNNFSEKRVLGHGGHGTVYKGLLKGNLEVAIKRCMSIDEQHKKEFAKEMLILSQINHKNIVKLLGCCLEVEVPMLVYEFVPNGTLFHLIHGNHGRHISLSTRLQIALHSAEALAYLHSWASPPILHGDVKSSNMLIDCEYTVKVSDFGASTLAPNDESQFVTLVQGTCGYLDPEYMQTCQLTDKSDVYSFGVVLLELLTRKKPFNLEGPEDEKSLAMRFIFMTRENKLEGILDNQIRSNENMEICKQIAELAKQCLEVRGSDRPTMKEVCERLDRLRKAMQQSWAQQGPEETVSFPGEVATASSEVVEIGN